MFVKKLIHLPCRLISYLFYKARFSAFGFHSLIQSPLRIDGYKNIRIGDHVIIQYKTWLGALPLTGLPKAELVIEEGAIIGHFNHIFATNKIVIKKNVLTADKVYISDNLHSYKDISIPILKQPIEQKGEVVIEEGSWLGENVCVLGAKIGKHCVVGANSVVTSDIPDYCVAVGSPARIVKRYDLHKQEWIKVD